MVDASVVHGLCGLWGMIAPGLFTTKVGYARAYDEVRPRGVRTDIDRTCDRRAYRQSRQTDGCQAPCFQYCMVCH